VTQVGVSILSMDYMNLGTEINTIEQTQSDFVHIDIMDGHFVPNITFGPDMVEQIYNQTDLFIDTHLMIESPEDYIDKFAKAGSDILTFHYESNEDKIIDIIEIIKNNEVKVGLAINPNTNVDKIKPYLSSVDLILQMTVEPGFGGQKFNVETLHNIKRLSAWRDNYNLSYFIEVDGGINKDTAKLCIEYGADTMIIGSSFIESSNKKKFVNYIQNH